MLWCCFLLNIPYHPLCNLTVDSPSSNFFIQLLMKFTAIEPWGNSSCSAVLLHRISPLSPNPNYAGSKDSRHWVAWGSSLVKSFHFSTGSVCLITWLVTRNFDVTCHINDQVTFDQFHCSTILPYDHHNIYCKPPRTLEGKLVIAQVKIDLGKNMHQKKHLYSHFYRPKKRA